MTTAQPAAQGMQLDRDLWVLEFPGMPLGPNDHVHWRTRARWNSYWRLAAGLRAREHSIPTMPRVRICAVFSRRAVGVADEDNDRARLKPIIDGLVAAGVIANDTREYVEWGTVTEQRGRKGVTVFVQRVEEALQ